MKNFLDKKTDVRVGDLIALTCLFIREVLFNYDLHYLNEFLFYIALILLIRSIFVKRKK